MDTTKLKNGKYYHGRYSDFGESKGWFVGSFFDENHPCKTNNIEVMYKEQPAGFITKPHYHEQKVELLIILEGSAKYYVNDNEVILKAGDFLFIDVNNIVSGEFLEPSKIFAIHSPSIISDKVVLE